MSNVMRDLWPDDIKSEDVISPEEILKGQASCLEERTGGQLAGYVVRHEGEDRVVIGFEVESVRAGSRIRLFEVQHRLELEYPAAIVPPDASLPDFLKKRVYRASFDDIAKVVNAASSRAVLTRPGEWVENEWVASSPSEFVDKVAEVLGSASVKGIVLSLLSRTGQDESPNDPQADES